MRLLFVSNVYPNPGQPQLGTFNAALIAALAREHQVEVVAPVSWTFRVRSRTPIPAVRTVATSNSSLRVCHPTFFHPPGLLRHHYGEFMWWSLATTLRAQADEFQPDAVVSYWAHPDGEVAQRLARELRVPHLCMVGGTDVLLLTQDRRRRESITRVLRQADQVITVSRDMADRVADFAVPAARIHVIYRGVDANTFSSGERSASRQKLQLPADVPLLLGVGRLVPVKGWQTLIEACCKLATRQQQFVCYVLGDGPLRPQFESLIQDKGLQDRVFLPGGKPQSQLADWYRAADLSVLTSESEGVPNVLLESMMCGTPFVASRVGGIPEIADPAHDRLVTPGDAELLAHAISEHLRKGRSAVPRRFLPQSWEESARKLAALIREPTDSVHAASMQQTTDRSSMLVGSHADSAADR